MTVLLEWSGKPRQVERLVLPFQSVETINESRATRERDSGTLFGRQDAGTAMVRNMLIWGDNKLVTSSLLKEYAGSVRLIYIDPPFDTGTDFSYRLSVGDSSVTKLPSILEEHAYRDTWSGGRASYLQMMYERIVLLYELLTADGSLYLHCAPNVSHYLKIICDEIFGSDHARAEIIGSGSADMAMPRSGRLSTK
jgi:adenine-specific DNA-methyltransferase